MSEYQYYEFVAIDRPLTKGEQSELRSCSSRARITSTGFVNEYHWGDLKGDPMEWMGKYFDAHLYLSNFGSLALHLRLPLALLDSAITQPYEEIPSLEVRQTATHVILSFLSEEESGGYYEDDCGSSSILSSILPVRDELARGDIRALYLAWLVAVQSREVKDDILGPPVPPGLAELSGAQQSLAEFLLIDPDLITAGKQTIGAYETQNEYTGLCPLSGLTGLSGRTCTPGQLATLDPQNLDAFPIKNYPEAFYHNARLNFEVPGTKKFNFYVGVDNIFDKKPPFGLLGTAGGDPYDTFGRFLYAGASIRM